VGLTPRDEALVDRAVPRQRLVEPCVGSGELVFGYEGRLDLVAAADELDMGDLLASEPPRRRLEP
jgi:hypothetical protein